MILSDGILLFTFTRLWHTRSFTSSNEKWMLEWETFSGQFQSSHILFNVEKMNSPDSSTEM